MKYSYEQFLCIILLQEESLKPPNQLQYLLQHKILQWVLFHADLVSESWLNIIKYLAIIHGTYDKTDCTQSLNKKEIET